MNLLPKNLLLGICLLLCILSGFALYRVFQEIFQPRYVNNVARVDNQSTQKSTVQHILNEFTPIPKTSYLIANIDISDNYKREYYEKQAHSTHNFLFFNTTNQSARRLIPNNNQIFLDIQGLGKSKSSSTQEIPGNYGVSNKANLNRLTEVSALWYVVVKEDTNKDKFLSSNDKKAIAMSDSSGDNYTEVVSGIDRIISTHPQEENRWLVFWYANKKNFVTEIDISSKKAVKTQELPSID